MSVQGRRSRRAGGSAARLVGIGAMLAAAGALHAVINVCLLRRPPPAHDGLSVHGVGGEPGAESLGRTSATVSVLIPARDEAATIVACLESLHGQVIAEILVLDDDSRDSTGRLARSVDDRRIRVIDGVALPPGHLGKPHACRQLAAEATGEILIFLDADVRLFPGAVRAATALLDRYGLDLVSPHPRELAMSMSERLVQPLLQWSMLTFLPLRLAERSSRPSMVAANGQFLAVRREAYERAGGHVVDAVLDDLALARAVIAHGGHCALADGTHLAECRMYDGWLPLRAGYTKSLWSAFGSVPGAVAVTGLLGWAYLVPAVAMLRGSRAGTVGYLAAVGGRVAVALRTGGRPGDAVAHPVSIAVLNYLTVRSLIGHRRSTLTWRGRPV